MHVADQGCVGITRGSVDHGTSAVLRSVIDDDDFEPSQRIPLFRETGKAFRK
jgi:hypothetical protein